MCVLTDLNADGGQHKVERPARGARVLRLGLENRRRRKKEVKSWFMAHLNTRDTSCPRHVFTAVRKRNKKVQYLGVEQDLDVGMAAQRGERARTDLGRQVREQASTTVRQRHL